MEDDIAILGHGTDGEQALHLAEKLKPDVILLDVNLPTINGIQVARRLKAKQPDVAVVMLTAYHEKEQVLHAMRSGASAYCAKDIRPEELVNVIRTVAVGLYVVDGKRIDRKHLKAWIQSRVEAIVGPNAIEPGEHLIPLSPRESEILESVTHGMSNKEIQ